MAKYPEVQKKAQLEIDGVIGTTRLPEFEDRPSLPYVEALYREVMRWSQSLPLASPHGLFRLDEIHDVAVQVFYCDAFSTCHC